MINKYIYIYMDEHWIFSGFFSWSCIYHENSVPSLIRTDDSEAMLYLKRNESSRIIVQFFNSPVVIIYHKLRLFLK